MVTFGNKILGLAAAAMTFAGMAFGQTCATGSATPNFIRVEGTTELLGTITLTCGAGLASGSLSLQVYLSPSLTVTSKVLLSGTGQTEAVAVITGAASGVGYATIGGNGQLNFTVPVTTGGASTVTISNIRVNANALTVTSGLPPAITATVFTSGSSIPSAGSVTVGNVAFAQTGLAATKLVKTTSATNSTLISGFNNYTICNATSAVAATPAFEVQVTEGFNGAFKAATGTGAATEASPANILAGAVGSGSVANTISSGTRLTVTFANLPLNGLTAYLPTAVTSVTPSTAVITLTSSTTGAFSAVAAGTSTTATALGSYAPFAVSGGTFQAVYEVTAADASNTDIFNIPVYFAASANPANASGTSTVAVAFAPVGSTNIPNFAQTSSTNVLSATAFNLCTTSLLFPFVTNASGFDTGLAISNTSLDPFGSTNGATAQAGTCTMNFYGATTNPAAITTPSVAAGAVYTNLISTLSPGFQGYMIAQCTFQFAHGFSFITDGFGGGGRGLSIGYLALVIPDTNQVARRTNATGELLEN